MHVRPAEAETRVLVLERYEREELGREHLEVLEVLDALCDVELSALRLAHAVDARIRVCLLATRVAEAVVVAENRAVGIIIVAAAADDDPVALAEGTAVAVDHRVGRTDDVQLEVTGRNEAVDGELFHFRHHASTTRQDRVIHVYRAVEAGSR